MAHSDLPDLEVYIAERNKVLMTRDPKQFISFMAKHGSRLSSSLKLGEITMHKVITAIPSMPMARRIESKRWLLERGYDSLDDGEVPTL